MIDSINGRGFSIPPDYEERALNGPTPLRRRPRRKRGGQPGNQNARKHGSYSSVGMSSEEITAFLDIMRHENIEPQVAFFRVKLKFLVETDPRNRRARNALSRQLAEYYRIKFRMDEDESKKLKKMVKRMLEEISHSVVPEIAPE